MPINSGLWQGAASYWRRTRLEHRFHPSRWLWVIAVGGSWLLAALVWSLVGAGRDMVVMRREAVELADSWDLSMRALTRDFDRLGGSVSPTCGSTTIRELVRASVTSPIARTFLARTSTGDVWCGPLGLRTAPPIVVDQPTDTRLLLSTRVGGTGGVIYATTLRGSTQLVAELDPRFQQIDVLRSAANVEAWDRDIRVGGSTIPFLHSPRIERPSLILLGRTTTSGSHSVVVHFLHSPRIHRPSQTLLAGTAASPSHAVVVEQRITWSHTLARLGRSVWGLSLVAILAALGIVALVVKRLIDRSSPERRLLQAIRKRRFEPFVQPIVSTTSGQCVGGEVLMRWRHPVRGVLPPSEFIQLAEETQLIVAMTNLIMIKARDQLAPLLAVQPELYFAFNVTPCQLRRPGIVNELLRLFDSSSLAPRSVVLEITEREFVDRTTLEALRELRAAGFRLAIDDFGTGQSSLALIEQLPLDRIKIDREFVRQIDDADTPRPVLDAIIAIAKTMGVPLIAEGVEHQVQWDYLTARGVQYVQGFLIARPLPMAGFAKWAAQHHVTPRMLAGAPVRTASLGRAINQRTSRADHDDSGAHTGDVDALVRAMSSPDGLESRDRMHAMRRYQHCFVATEAVDWMVERLGLSRPSAERLGQRLTALGHFEHVVEEHDFADAYLFFRLLDTSAPSGAAPPSYWLEPATVAQRLRGQDGPQCGTKQRRLIRYQDCITGSDLAAWMEEQFSVPAGDVAQLGNGLMRLGAIIHVHDDRPFSASGELFRIC
jgi:EAL domain-containing protein (putative c-di-GMP-specific phosphodiesterase class I)